MKDSMYMSISKFAECNHIELSTEDPATTDTPISIRFMRTKESGCSELYLSLTLDQADELQAKLSATLQDLRTREDDKAVELADEINKHKEEAEDVG